MAKALTFLMLISVGCAERKWGESRPCVDSPPSQTEVIVDDITCIAERFDGLEEARPSDMFIGNNLLRAVVRHPESSPTLAGLGGGSLIDLATWDGHDVLHEAAPLIDGSWLEVLELTKTPNSISIGGYTRPLPDHLETSHGEWAEISWRIEPNDPRIYLDNASGLWLHPKGPSQLYGTVIHLGNTLLTHDGVVNKDVGGALRIDGLSWILISEASQAWRWLDDASIQTTLTSPRDGTLFVYDELQAISQLPIIAGTQTLVLPAQTSRLAATSNGVSPSLSFIPSEEHELVFGPEGSLTLRPSWQSDDAPVPLWVEWIDPLEQAHGVWISPEGTRLNTGAGNFSLHISGPPWIEEQTVLIEVQPNQHPEINLEISQLFSPNDYTLMSFDRSADRSRATRSSDEDSIAHANAMGSRFSLFSALDDVPEVEVPAELKPYISIANSSIATSADGWSILAWPWTASFRRSAHGATDTRTIDPQTALAAAWGGPTTNRFTAANSQWFREVNLPPHAVNPRPDFIRLDAPVGTPTTDPDWRLWFDWLNQGAYLLPLGPKAWVKHAYTVESGPAALQDTLVQGQMSATTGPLLTLEERSTAENDPPPVFSDPFTALALSLEAKQGDIEHVAIIGDGVLLQQWTVHNFPWEWSGTIRQDPSWIIAVGWNENRENWTTTAPLWIHPPQ